MYADTSHNKNVTASAACEFRTAYLRYDGTMGTMVR